MENINLSFFIMGEAGTKTFAQNLAPYLKSGDCILLTGDLGAGKTTFSRYLIQSMTQEKVEVVSPTFTLVQTYDTQMGELNHLDLYRLEDENDLIELGWDEMAYQTITVVEWPDRLGGARPKRHLEITISMMPQTMPATTLATADHSNGEENRHMTITMTGSWPWAEVFRQMMQNKEGIITNDH